MCSCMRVRKVSQGKTGHGETADIAPDVLRGMLLKYITARLEGCQECVRV